MRKKSISLIYLIAGTIAVFGYLNFFFRWIPDFTVLSLLAALYYLMSMIMVILIHPVICLVLWIKRSCQNAKTKSIKIHFFWSLSIGIAYWVMVFNGYALRA